MQDREVLTEMVSVALTRREKAMLNELTKERGATMRGFIRKLIRDAYNAQLAYVGLVGEVGKVGEASEMDIQEHNGLIAMSEGRY